MVGHVACDYNLPYSLIPFLLNTSQCNCIIEISLCITISPLIKKTVAFCPVAFCPVAFCPVAFCLWRFVLWRFVLWHYVRIPCLTHIASICALPGNFVVSCTRSLEMRYIVGRLYLFFTRFTKCLEM